MPRRRPSDRRARRAAPSLFTTNAPPDRKEAPAGTAAPSARERSAGAVRSAGSPPAWWIPWLLSLAVVAAAAASAVSGYESLFRQQDRIAALSAEIERLQAEAAAFRAEIVRLEQDPEALDLIAREEHQLAGEGEIVALLEFDGGAPTR